MEVYQIRDKGTGLYRAGGYYGGWSKRGKVWNSIKSIKLHMSMVKDRDLLKIFGNSEIVVLKETGDTIDLREMVMKDKNKEKTKWD